VSRVERLGPQTALHVLVAVSFLRFAQQDDTLRQQYAGLADEAVFVLGEGCRNDPAAVDTAVVVDSMAACARAQVERYPSFATERAFYKRQSHQMARLTASQLVTYFCSLAVLRRRSGSAPGNCYDVRDWCASLRQHAATLHPAELEEVADSCGWLYNMEHGDDALHQLLKVLCAEAVSREHRGTLAPAAAAAVLTVAVHSASRLDNREAHQLVTEVAQVAEGLKAKARTPTPGSVLGGRRG